MISEILDELSLFEVVFREELEYSFGSPVFCSSSDELDCSFSESDELSLLMVVDEDDSTADVSLLSSVADEESSQPTTSPRQNTDRANNTLNFFIGHPHTKFLP